MIRLHGQQFWLYGAVDPYTNEILHVSLYPTTTKQTTRWFLTDLHQRYRLNDVEFLVDDADYLGPVLAEDGYRFRVIRHGNRNAIERVFWEIERRTSSFANSFSNVALETAQKLARSLRRLPQFTPNLTRPFESNFVLSNRVVGYNYRMRISNIVALMNKFASTHRFGLDK